MGLKYIIVIVYFLVKPMNDVQNKHWYKNDMTLQHIKIIIFSHIKPWKEKKKKTQQCLRSTKWIFHRQKFLPPAFPLVWCTHEVQLLLYTFRMDGKHGSQDHLALLMDHRRVQVLPVLTVILGGSACGPEERQQQGQDMEHQHPDLYSAQTVHPCDDMITTELYRCRLMKRLSGGKKRVTNTSKATHE